MRRINHWPRNGDQYFPRTSWLIFFTEARLIQANAILQLSLVLSLLIVSSTTSHPVNLLELRCKSIQRWSIAASHTSNEFKPSHLLVPALTSGGFFNFFLAATQAVRWSHMWWTHRCHSDIQYQILCAQGLLRYTQTPMLDTLTLRSWSMQHKGTVNAEVELVHDLLCLHPLRCWCSCTNEASAFI